MGIIDREVPEIKTPGWVPRVCVGVVASAGIGIILVAVRIVIWAFTGFDIFE